MIPLHHNTFVRYLKRNLILKNSAIQRLFSYTLDYKHTSDCAYSAQISTITLRQQETGCMLSFTIHHDGEGLYVHQFHLMENGVLAGICSSLYDAALIDLVLHALNLQLHCASYWQHPRITWALPPEDAEHITYLNQFFQTHYHDPTALQTCIPASAQDYAEFCERIGEIQHQVYQTLWQYQKSDLFLRRYLHDPSIRHNLQTQNTHPSPSEAAPMDGQVLTFPQPAS